MEMYYTSSGTGNNKSSRYSGQDDSHQYYNSDTDFSQTSGTAADPSSRMMSGSGMAYNPGVDYGHYSQSSYPGAGSTASWRTKTSLESAQRSLQSWKSVGLSAASAEGRQEPPSGVGPGRTAPRFPGTDTSGPQSGRGMVQSRPRLPTGVQTFQPKGGAGQSRGPFPSSTSTTAASGYRYSEQQGGSVFSQGQSQAPQQPGRGVPASGKGFAPRPPRAPGPPTSKPLAAGQYGGSEYGQGYNQGGLPPQQPRFGRGTSAASARGPVPGGNVPKPPGPPRARQDVGDAYGQTTRVSPTQQPRFGGRGTSAPFTGGRGPHPSSEVRPLHPPWLNTQPRPSSGPRMTTQDSPAAGPVALMDVTPFQSRLQEFSTKTCGDLGISVELQPQTGQKKHCSLEGFSTKTEQMKPSQTEGEVEPESDDDDDDDEDDIDMSQCKLCNIKFVKEQAYHVHIRSTSHNQKMAEEKKQKKLAKQGLPLSESETSPSSSKPAAVTTAGLKSPSSQSSTCTGRTEDKAPRGPNYCDVCCFEFSGAEVYKSHLLGLVHKQKLEEQQKSAKSAQKTGDEGSSSQKWDTTPIRAEDFGTDDSFRFSTAPFMCKVCNIACTGEKSYEMHVAGAKHQKKLKRNVEVATFEKKSEERTQQVEEPILAKARKARGLRIQEQLDRCSEPLIGLDYMTEYQMEDPNADPCYICDLCQSKMDMRQVIHHVVGIRHRHKYMKFHGVRDYWDLYYVRRKSEKVRLATEIAASYQRREGRHKIRVKVLMIPFSEGDNNGGKQQWEEDAANRPTRDLPGLKTMAEINAKYKPMKEEEDDDVDDDDRTPPPDDRPPRDFDRHSPPSFARPYDRLLPPTWLSYGAHPGYPSHPAAYHRGQYDMLAGPPMTASPYDRMHPYESVSYLDRPGYSRYSERTVFDYSDRGDATTSRYGDRPSSERPGYSPQVVDYNHSSISAASSEKKAEAEADAGRDDAKRTEIVPSRDESLYQSAQDTDARPVTTLDADVDIKFIQDTIAGCNMNTEDDAELALKISNALTQALLEHRQSALRAVGKSDDALESHLVDLRAQNAELVSAGSFAGSDRMQSALAAALRLASMLTSNQSPDTIQQAMAVLDSVNKKLYGMIDQSDQQAQRPSSQSLDSVRGYGGDDDDDDDYQMTSTQYGLKRPTSPTRSTQRSAAAGPSKRFHFGL